MILEKIQKLELAIQSKQQKEEEKNLNPANNNLSFW